MMSLREVAVALSVFALAGACFAGPKPGPDRARVVTPVRADGLLERTGIPKKPSALLKVPQMATGRLLIKFVDSAKARVQGQQPVSLTRQSLTARDVLQQYGLACTKAINHSDQALAELEARAAQSSGKAQPDLAAMMYVEGNVDQATLLEVARILNDLPEIEFVEFEVPLRTIRSPQAGGGFGAEVLSQGPLVDAANSAFGVSESLVATLPVPATPGAGFALSVPIEVGEWVDISFEPNSLRTFDFAMYEAQPNGSLVEIDPGPERTVRGELSSMNGGKVAGALFDNGLFATIIMPDGSRYWVQPMAGEVPGAVAGQHIIYRNQDVIAPPGICGVENVGAPPFGGGGGVAGGGGPAGPGFTGCYAELALDLDSSWVEKAGDVFGAGTLAAAVINVVNLQYEVTENLDPETGDPGVNIRHVLTAIVVRPTPASDPYTTNSPGDLLSQFRAEWNANLSSVRRDVAHLLTGRDLDGGVIGIAFLDAVCQTSDFDGQLINYGLSQRYGAFSCQTDLTAHELGHNWSARHCECFGPSPEDNYTMNPFITCANRFNPMATIPDIVAFRDSIAGDCLDCGGSAPSGCGDGATNDCSSPALSPYCNDAVCCGGVCAVEPFCCDVRWDPGCVDLANELCLSCGAEGSGDCYTPNLTPGCDDADCCELVGMIDPACASGFWDENCAIIAALSCSPDEMGPTPNFTSFQAYLTSEATPGFEIVTNIVLAESFTGEGFDLNGLDALTLELFGLGVGETDPPDSNDPDDLLYNTRGRGINVASIEDSAYINHEDLDIILEPGIDPTDLFLNEQITSPSHGTATLGIMNAKDNISEVTGQQIGMVGIAPEAQGYFFPTTTLSEGGRTLTAIISALQTFGPGDILNMSIGPVNASGNDCTAGVLTSSPGIYAVVRLGSDLGITSVISAGNDCCNLDAAPEAGDDSGAIIVSACDPGYPYCRRAFSNHSDEDQIIPQLSAWGVCVATTGGAGDLFGPVGNPTRQYTYSFNGTSAAAPLIAGMAARMQGLARQFFGLALTPEQIRASLSEGTPQCDIINPQDRMGNDPDLDACAGDTFPPEDSDPNIIGLFPDALSAAGNVINGNWFSGSPNINTFVVITGDYVEGNDLSITAVDNNYLIMDTEYVQGGDSPNVNPIDLLGLPIKKSMIDQIIYIATGQVTDVAIVGHVSEPLVTSMFLTTVAQHNGGLGFIFYYAYNWSTGQWNFVGYNQLAGGAEDLQTVTINGASNYVASDGSVVVRMWTYGIGNGSFFGGGNPASGTFRVWLNFASLNFGINPGDG